MFRRLLGRMGWSNYIPGSNDMGFDNRNTDAPDAPMGEAHITYLGGAKTPYSPEEAAQQERGEDVEADLVWPGKPTTMGLRNEESQAYRYNLTITNLPAGHYVLLPPTGGIRQPEGGVLLQPGEEAVFEVRFPPIAREQMPPQSFHFVLTRFDPRRRNDPGVVVGEDAARWVPLPSAADFALRADTGELRLRPWRRIAKFMLSLEDRSFLPSDANLHILRAPTKQALTEHAEQVETISQPLPARTSGTWRCELPPTQLRTSCWVIVRGAVRAGEHQTVPIALPKPIYVRYVPWLRMGRDWLFLGTSLFSLMWLLWGIPVYKSPVVYMPVRLGDKSALPTSAYNDLRFQIDSVDGKPIKPIPGVLNNSKVVFEDWPKRWYGNRWPFNSWSGRAPHTFKVSVSLANSDNSDAYAMYNIARLKLDDKTSAQTSDDSKFVISTSDRHILGEWALSPKAVIPVKNGVHVNISLDDNSIVREAVQHGDDVKLVYTIDGKRQEQTLTLSPDEKQAVLHNVDLDVKRPGKLKLYVEVGKAESNSWVKEVKLQQNPIDVHLSFPEPPKVQGLSGSFRPGEQISIPGNGLGERGEVFVNGTSLPTKPSWTPGGVNFTLPPTPRGTAIIVLQPETGRQITAGSITVLEPRSEGVTNREVAPPARSVAENHPVTKKNNKPAAHKDDPLPLTPQDEAKLAGRQPGANLAQPNTTAKPGGTSMPDVVQSPLASSHSPAMPQTKLPSTPDPHIAPPSTSLSKQPVSKGVVTTPAPEVKFSSGTQKIVVQSNTKKLTLQGDNLGRKGEAWLSGADGRTQLRVQKWKSNMVEVDMPRHSASGMAALELTGSNHTVLADYTLYQVPKNLHSKYEERNRGGERSEKEIVSRLHQSVSALRDYQNYAAKQFWSPAYNALKNAEAQYVFILQTGHTAEDAVNAHYNLALIAQDMSTLPPNLTPADDATQCLKQARQEAWIAAQENSQSPTPLTDDIFRLINRLESATE